MTSIVSTSREISYSEYLTLPEDPHAELLDGRYVVNEPSFRHQAVVYRLMGRLEQVLPAPLAVYGSVGWHIDDRWEPGPDVVVVPEDDDLVRFTGTPALAVEVLSPSNRRTDLVLKMQRYAEAGLPYYWIVDVDVPSVTTYSLTDGAYVEVARSTGADSATLPFQGGSLTLAAADLLRRR